MQLKYLSSVIIVCTIMIFMTSCNKSNTVGRYIPANASVIVHINGESISAKLPWEEVKQNELFQTIYSDSSLSALVKSALDNPENTGIDPKKDLIFFLSKDSTGTYIAFEGTIKDSAKFKAYNTAALKNSTLTEKDAVHYLSNEKTTVSWDKTKFIVITDAPDKSNMNDMHNWMDKMENQLDKDSNTAVTPTPKPKRNTNTTAAQIYSISEGNSMAKNEKFTDLINNKGDIHFWMNAEKITTDIPDMPGLSMVNLNKLYEGSLAAGTINFENGKINVDMKSYAGKEMTAIFKKYSGSKMSSDMVKRLPAKDVAVFLAMNFKPEGIKEFLKLLGLDGFINMGSAFLGFNLDDFVKANKGDILLSISDITKDSSGKPNASVLFSVAIGDRPSFDKLINAGKKAGKNELGSMASKIYFNSNEQYFSIGNNKANIDQFIAKEGNSQFAFYDKIASSPIGGFVNLQYILKATKNVENKDSLTRMALEASEKIWENIIISGGNFENGGITQHFEINLIDKSTNSLKQMNNYIAVMGKIAKAKKKENNGKDFTWPGSVDTISPAVDTSTFIQ